MGRLWLDTAVMVPSALGPVVSADYRVPCSTEKTMEVNRLEVLGYERLSEEEREAIGRNMLVLFPGARERLAHFRSSAANVTSLP